MPLSAGDKLGHYEIVGPLGAGGMGEVYRARDPRLDREVAVKVLPASVSSNAEVRARFEREAKTISSLNHPHICTLHDVGREGDVDFLVMELVEGETLAERLIKGPLPPNEVLKFGGQIADALDRAHRAGVVHRDLKPGNVMLTRSGAKLLDFGLARVTGLAGADSGLTLTHSPTIAQPLTAEGTIVGTFQYMAPEQLEGKEIDERADLWALGCVLYEMATGKRAFEGPSQASVIAAIMHTEPEPIPQVAPLAPASLDGLIRACLSKDPSERIQSAHDVKLQLGWMANGATSTMMPAPSLPPSSRRPSWLALLLVGLAVAVVTFTLTRLFFADSAAPSAPQPQRYTLGDGDFQPTSVPLLSLDGTYVVLSVVEGITCRLYRRDLASFEMTPIEGTQDGLAPFFSPDGAWLGFVKPDGIYKVPAGGGIAQLIVEYPRPSAGEWTEDGMIYFTARNGGDDASTALARVAETGGSVEVLARLDLEAGEVESWLPEMLPDGRTVLFSTIGGPVSPQVLAYRPDGSRQALIPNAFLPRYVETGHLLYRNADSQAVLAVPFDPDRLEMTGTAVPVTAQVDGSYCFDTNTNTIVYVPLPGAGEGSEVVWLDRNGRASSATDVLSAWIQPRVSPDGNRVLLRKVGNDCELWMLDVERRSVARIVHGDDNHDPVWAPDGRRIAFEQANSARMTTLTVQGPREMVTLAEGRDHGSPHSWSAGNLLAYTVSGQGTRTDIWVRTIDDSAPPQPFLASEFNEDNPAISPDGQWIAYESEEAGGRNVFVRPYPDTGTAWQVSTDGGSSPVWSRDGTELYFVSAGAMKAAPIESGETLRIGTPTVLFEGGFNPALTREFDVAPDGRFIVARRPGGDDGEQELRMLVNWPQEMARVSGGVR